MMSEAQSKKVKLEVCVDSVDSAIAAQEGGAARVELCDNLFEGGTTPSAGMIAVARKSLTIGLQVIIRPRGGDFLYSSTEFEVMKRDVLIAKQLGADGVVIGILERDGSVDVPRTRELIDLARPLQVTFHRAFDMTRDPHAALETLVNLGVERVLTSGQQATVPQGIELIAALVRQAGARIIVMPGGGITLENAAKIAAASSAKEIHLGDLLSVPSIMTFRNERVYMGGAYTPSEYTRMMTDAARIRRIVALLPELDSGWIH
jgi:copper homeostasis protein